MVRAFGTQKEFVLEHKSFIAVCFFSAIIFFISVGINFLIGLNLEITISTLVFGFLFSFFYYLSRFKGYFYLVYWIVFFCGCLFVLLAWFYTGGISGTATIISLIILAIINMITEKQRRKASILILCLFLGLLYVVEYFKPGFVVAYDNNKAMFMDNYFTFIFAVLIISFVIHFTMQNLKIEKNKVRDREEKLKAILDNIPDLVWLKDNESKFTMINKPFADAFGVPVTDIIGKTGFEIRSPNTTFQFQKDDNDILTATRMSHREEILVDSQQGEKRFEIIKKAIMDQQGKITGVVGMAKDITAQYEYEDRLKKYERIVGTSMDQMALINRKYEYEAVNISYLTAYACHEQDLIGNTLSDAHGTCVFEEKIKPYIDKAFLGEVVTYQDEVEYCGIGRRYVETCFFPYKNNYGHTVSVVAHIKDITGKKQMEQRLARSEKMEAMGTLAGGIAHDFNNILSGILGYAQLGKINTDRPENLNHHLNQIIKGSKRAGELVKQILTFSRQYEYEKQPLKVAVIVKEALKLIRATIPTFIEMKKEIVSNAMIFADPSQIHQIIMNLCTNAYHSMLENKGTGKLIVTLKDVRIAEQQWILRPSVFSDSFIELSVSDTGCGIDKRIMEKMFDPYFTTKELGKGTGLGLALVHSIVEEHNGGITVDSRLGCGTDFRLFFPAVEQTIQTDEHFNVPVNAMPNGTESIMVVDDEESILFSTRELLEDCGYQVKTFPDGCQAYEEFKKAPYRYDLIVTDMTMPKMTGDDLAIEVLKLRPDLPVILCTGYSDLITQDRALEIGIRRYLQKPIYSYDFTVLIRSILEETRK
ncbi:MAG: PAS domain S-box protein [Pseudomonadota bacterium]